MVSNLSGMMKERLELFRTHNRLLPQRILVYRDGVSEVSFTTAVLSSFFMVNFRASSKLSSTKSCPRLGPPVANLTLVQHLTGPRSR
jgi:hypothetical protein